MNRERLHSEIIGTLNSLIWLIQRSGDDGLTSMSITTRSYMK